MACPRDGRIRGAAGGGAAGALIGRRTDRQAEELAAVVEGAKVERVGEGLLVTFDSGIPFDFDSDLLRSAARDELRELGVEDRRIRATGRGEREPVATNDSERGRRENRRVEVAIYAGEAARAGT